MPISIFLSYARGDDEEFVRRLHNDLTKARFDVWFDRVSMPSRQLTFHQEIRDANAARGRVVFVIGPRAAVSEYVGQEWRWALEMGKCVNPIVRLDGQQRTDGTRVDGYELLPEELKLIHAEDFRDDAGYAPHLANIIRQLSEPPPPLGRLFGVPSLPTHYRAQPDRVKQLREALLVDLHKPMIASGVAGLTGGAAARLCVNDMGGIGKSLLANALARNLEIRRAFPGGIFWIRIGQQPNVVELQRQAVNTLGGDAMFDDTHTGKQRLRELLEQRAALLVLDDVWQRAHADAFDVLGPKCKLLFTTRDAGLGTALAGTSYQVQLPTMSEALALVATAAQAQIDALPSGAREVVDECGRLPLALMLCGGMVQAGTSWQDLVDALREHDLAFPENPHDTEEQHLSIWRTIDVSMHALPEEQHQRFMELAVFPPVSSVPEAAVLTLWAHTGDLDERRARKLLVELKQRSLLQIDHPVGRPDSARVSLHDLIHDFATRDAIERTGGVAPLHQMLLEAWRTKCPEGWPDGPNDGWFLQHLRDHLCAAERADELASLLLELRWLETKNDAGLAFDLIQDFETALRVLPAAHAEHRLLSLLNEALRRDIHFIARHAENYPQALFQCLWNSCCGMTAR